jgi:hypothetical protein
MSSPGEAKKQGMRCVLFIAAFALAPACGKKVEERSKGRKEPVCAVQDCVTNKILDNGCDDTGRCASCVNSCASSDRPSAAPSAR